MALIKITKNTTIEVYRKKRGYAFDIFINKRRTTFSRKTYPTYEEAYLDALSECLTID